MYDLTPAFMAARRDAPRWDHDALHRALGLVSDRCPDVEVDASDVDDSGKNWARMYGGEARDDRSEHFGIMWSEGPLCFLSPHIARCVGSELESSGVTVIVVDDFDAQRYRIDASASECLFGSTWNASYVDPDRMSVLDLEWMTM